MRQTKKKAFEIPINELDIPYENEKKEEIEDFLLNNNKLENISKFHEIKGDIESAIYSYDLELVKILLLPSIIDDDLIFKIDKENQTAILFKIRGTCYKDEIIIPHHINHGSTKYIITGIAGSYSSTKSVGSLRFAEDSEVRTIYTYSFFNSSITNLYIPKSLTELKDDWCYKADKLTNIEISPLNTNFIFKNKKYLLGKSDPKSDNFDILLFSVRDITIAFIPSNIKVISPHAFGSCHDLTFIEFPKNSELLTIERSAFSDSNLKQIAIPPHVSKIGRYAFYNCENLRILEIPKNSELKSIGCYAFQYTKIDKIFIPTNFEDFDDKWCGDSKFLNTIELSELNKNFILKNKKILLGKSDKKSDNLDILLFSARDITKVVIPSNIKIISSCAFEYCQNLTSIEFSENSELHSIGKKAFSFSNIKEIDIPHHVSKIGARAFRECKNLEIVKIPKNSELKLIDKGTFNGSKIRKIFIPKQVSKIEKSAFHNCKNLRDVEFTENSELKLIENNAFSYSKINKIFIPKEVVRIGIEAFRYCKNLQFVKFNENSDLEIIDYSAFEYSSISNVFIPSHVTEIGQNAFNECNNFQIIEISENTKLQKIDILEFRSYFPFLSEPKFLIMIPTNLDSIVNCSIYYY